MKLRNVPLNCGHNFLAKEDFPQEGEEVFCRKCADYSIVLVSIDLYRWRCLTDGCRTGRGGSRDRWGIGKRARRHTMTRQHSVQILRGDEVLETWTPDQPTLWTSKPAAGDWAVNQKRQAESLDRIRAMVDTERARASTTEGTT